MDFVVECDPDLIEYKPPALSGEVVKQIADIFTIDLSSRPQFAVSLASLFDLARRDHIWDVNFAASKPVVEAELAELREILKALKYRLDTLHAGTRQRLGLHTLCRRECELTEGAQLRFYLSDMVHDGGVEQGEREVGAFRRTISEFIAGACLEVWPKRAGRPSKRLDVEDNPQLTAYDLFVPRFVRLIREAGSKETLDKNAGGGTLMDALRTIEPHLPSGFFPNGLLAANANGGFSGLSRLQSLRQQGYLPTGQKP